VSSKVVEKKINGSKVLLVFELTGSSRAGEVSTYTFRLLFFLCLLVHRPSSAMAAVTLSDIVRMISIENTKGDYGRGPRGSRRGPESPSVNEPTDIGGGG